MSHPVRRLLLVHNPIAGRRRRWMVEAVAAALGRAGIAVDIVATQAAGDARRIAATLDAACYDALLVAGGDGTLNEAASGLVQRDGPSVPMALLPLGTANVLAIELGLSIDVDAIVRAVVAGRVRSVRPGSVTAGDGAGRLFLLMAGVGFDAHVVAAVTPPFKRRFGKAAYGWRAAVEMARAVPRRYRVEIDGATHDAASVIVSRARHYAGPYVLAPSADLEADELQVVLLTGSGRASLLRNATALLRGRLATQGDVRILKAQQVSIRGAAPDAAREPVQIDGDDALSLPIEVSIFANNLQILA